MLPLSQTRGGLPGDVGTLAELGGSGGLGGPRPFFAVRSSPPCPAESLLPLCTPDWLPRGARRRVPASEAPAGTGSLAVRHLARPSPANTESLQPGTPSLAAPPAPLQRLPHGHELRGRVGTRV